MAKKTRKVEVYLNSNRIDEVSIINYLDNYAGSISSLFKTALRDYIDKTPKDLKHQEIMPEVIANEKSEPQSNMSKKVVNETINPKGLLDSFTL
tara:strand:+ start:5790 stop:6071 length:282 start_codon:yes stop_codon:yes gene_type:complete